MKYSSLILSILITITPFITSCRHDEMILPSEETEVPVDKNPDFSISSLYLLNEGNMGSNKCSLDLLDFTSGLFYRNIYQERNPNVIKELGDVGNDIAVYGSRLYIVVNCSHKVEVLDAYSGIRIGQVDIPNCRFIKFKKGKAYITSYVGPVQVDPDSPKGAVFEVDTASLAITRRVSVGYQPEEFEIIGNYIYVANSGGYRAPDYDTTVSVIDIPTFRQIRLFNVAPNLQRIRADKYNRLWVSSRSAGTDYPAALFLVSVNDNDGELSIVRKFNTTCSNLDLYDDTLYYLSASSSATDGKHIFGKIDINNLQHITDCFITDGSEKNIIMPYGIKINPESGDIYITDARNYVSSGMLHCYTSEGKLKWSVKTGDIPSAMTFLFKQPHEK